MIICLIFKFLVSFFILLFFTVFSGSKNLFFQAFIVGIVPVWSEVVMTKIMNFEPAKVNPIKYRILDSIGDILSFVLIPAVWFFQAHSWPRIVLVGLAVFVFCGIYRVLRFLRYGLKNGMFEGLPVTYTGYVWIFLVLIHKYFYEEMIFLILLSIAYLMISKRIRIQPSR